MGRMKLAQNCRQQLHFKKVRYNEMKEMADEIRLYGIETIRCFQSDQEFAGDNHLSYDDIMTGDIDFNVSYSKLASASFYI